MLQVGWDGWTDGRTDGRTDGWMDGMGGDGWMGWDRQIERTDR
jgi:hypothetical protein